MKLEDMAKVKRLNMTVENCDFMADALYRDPEAGADVLRIWAGQKGALLESYAEDRWRYVSKETAQQVCKLILTDIALKRAEAVEQMAALGVEVPSP